MSWSREITIWCDGCSTWQQESETINSLRRILKKSKWSTKKIGKRIYDYCPECTEKLKKDVEQ